MSTYGKLFEEALAAELRAEKARLHITETEIGDLLGIHRVSVSRYLSGARSIPIGVLAELCRKLDLDAFEIINKAEIQAKRKYTESAEHKPGRNSHR